MFLILRPDPLIAILGATRALSYTNKYEKKKAVLFGMVIAKKLILSMWKMDAVPTYDLWLGEMANKLLTSDISPEEMCSIRSWTPY